MPILTLKILCFFCLYGIYYTVSSVYKNMDTMEVEEFGEHLSLFGLCVLAPLFYIWMYNV